MTEAVSTKEELINYLTTKPLAKKEPPNSVYVTGKVRKEILTDEQQGKFIYKGSVVMIGFKNLGGGVYEAYIEYNWRDKK